MTITLLPALVTRLKIEADRRGLEASECALQILNDSLPPHPDQATRDLLTKWAEEDATDDLQEIARREREGEELMLNLARNRFEM